MSDTQVLAPVLSALLERTEAIAGRTIERLYDGIPSYSVVPRAELAESIGQIVSIVVDVLRAGEVPAAAEIRQAETSSVARARLDIPIQDIMQAFRFTMRSIQEAVVAEAQLRSVPPETLIRITSLLWGFSDAYTANQVHVHRASDIDRALRRTRRRQEYVRALAFGILGPADAVEAGREFGLDPARLYRAVRARASDGDSTEQLRRALESEALARGLPALYAIVSDDCLGVIAGEPRVDAEDATIAYGAPGRLDAIADSFRTAGKILAPARSLGITGTVGMADLSWRLAGVDAPEVNAYLESTYLAPLRAHGAFGEQVLESVASYLEADRSIPRAAERIPVHVNTLRYRLRRFEELTGASLASTNTLVEVSFALRVTEPLKNGFR